MATEALLRPGVLIESLPSGASGNGLRPGRANMGNASNVDRSVTVAKLSTLLTAAGLAVALWIIAISTGLLGWVIAASVASAGTLLLAGFLLGVRRGEENVTYPVTGTYYEGAKEVKPAPAALAVAASSSTHL